MRWITFMLLSTILWGCSQDHDPNDPYVIENTEIKYEPPEPYYYPDGDTD